MFDAYEFYEFHKTYNDLPRANMTDELPDKQGTRALDKKTRGPLKSLHQFFQRQTQNARRIKLLGVFDPL